MSERHGNPDGMESLRKYSRMPLGRVRYVANADTKLINEIHCGVLFIMAFWSVPSVKAFSEITEILNRIDSEATLEFVTVDTDGAEPFYTHPEFIGKTGGWGEIAWIKNGVIQRTSGLGYNPECFEPNTRWLMESC